MNALFPCDIAQTTWRGSNLLIIKKTNKQTKIKKQTNKKKTKQKKKPNNQINLKI